MKIRGEKMENNISPAAQRLIDAFNQFKKLHRRKPPIEGMNHSEIGVLFCIKENSHDEKKGIKVSDIGSCLKVTTPTVTQLINKLETNGFVERSMDKEDRRAVRVRITEEGEKVLKRLSEGFLAKFKGLAEYLGEEDSNKLAELLSKSFTYFDKDAEKDN